MKFSLAMVNVTHLNRTSGSNPSEWCKQNQLCWCHDPDQSEVYRAECNGGQLASSLPSRGMLETVPVLACRILMLAVTGSNLAWSELSGTGYKFIDIMPCSHYFFFRYNFYKPANCKNILCLCFHPWLSVVLFSVSHLHLFPCRSFLKPQSHRSRRVTSAWTI